MVELELDGKKVEVPEGSMVMDAAEKLGTYIPHFCYHKKLSLVASCRMCLVEVEKAPKAVPACATPVADGMVVKTKSSKAIQAQQSVMEFLLINHPLDCPICDQAGECQLQDLAVGYGKSGSRYKEEKRVVKYKDVGPLISMEEMARCIHCTRCVRFGKEIAGVMELGMTHRGEFAEIETFVGRAINSELSGNMIDICPVGALTSKPFRYAARTWELSRRKSISPHDSTGSNLIIQVKNHQVKRVVPFENEAINECWIADRDRFSYEALNSAARLTTPMVKQGGKWLETDWQQALEYVANGVTYVREEYGNQAVGALVSPHSTLEEMYLTEKLIRGLASESIDYRLRNAEFSKFEGVRWLGTSIASLSDKNSYFVIGSNLRKDHPLFAQRIRRAVRMGARLFSVNEQRYDWAMFQHLENISPFQEWTKSLAQVAAAVAQEKKIVPPAAAEITEFGQKVAAALLAGEASILLGNAAAHHPQASKLLAFAQWLAEQTGASYGYLTEAANTVGAQALNLLPGKGGLTAAQMLRGEAKAIFLVNNEPIYDSAAGINAAFGLKNSSMVVTLSPFKANLEFSDVLLPIAPFTETAGSFINAQGDIQSFYGVVKPWQKTRPAWKVLRVLANLLELEGFDFETIEDVRQVAWPTNLSQQLSNKTQVQPLVESLPLDTLPPRVASIYQLDSIVRRAESLQDTADGIAGVPAASKGCGGGADSCGCACKGDDTTAGASL